MWNDELIHIAAKRAQLLLNTELKDNASSFAYIFEDAIILLQFFVLQMALLDGYTPANQNCPRV
jgi:hypothetical protein